MSEKSGRIEEATCSPGDGPGSGENRGLGSSPLLGPHIQGERMAKPALAVFYYQVYIHRWRGSETRAATNLEQRGLLWELLFHAAAEGSLPTDPATLANIAGCSRAEFGRAWPKIKDKFIERDGRLYHSVVDEELARMADLQAKRSEGGRIGAKKRWVSHSSPNGSPIGTPNGSVVANECQIGNRKQEIGNSTSEGDPSSNGWDPQSAFEELASAYPAHRSSRGHIAQQNYIAATGGTEERHARLMALLDRCKGSEQWQAEAGKFVPGMPKFLADPPWHILEAPVEPVPYKSIEELQKEAWG